MPMKRNKDQIVTFRISDSWKRRAELVAELGELSLSQLAHEALCEKVFLYEEIFAQADPTGKVRQKIGKVKGDKDDSLLIRKLTYNRVLENDMLKAVVAKLGK
jgi:hypothetical protein